jgi:hypothetical protein
LDACFDQNRNSEKWEQYICGLIMPNNIYGVMGLMAGIKDPFRLGKTKSILQDDSDRFGNILVE